MPVQSERPIKYMRLANNELNNVGVIYHALAICGEDMYGHGETQLSREILEIANVIRERYDILILPKDTFTDAAIEDFAWRYCIGYGALALQQATTVFSYLLDLGFSDTTAQWRKMLREVKRIHAAVMRKHMGREILPINFRMNVWQTSLKPRKPNNRPPAPEAVKDALDRSEPFLKRDEADEFDDCYIRAVKAAWLWRRLKGKRLSRLGHMTPEHESHLGARRARRDWPHS